MRDPVSANANGPQAGLLAPSQALSLGFESAPAKSAAGVPAVLSGALRRQGFRIGSLRLMIAYEDGSELTELPPVYALPNAPNWFLGMANLHGTLVPVFDPATIFGIEHDREAKPMLLVLGHGDEKAGLVIDGLPRRLLPKAADRIDNVAVPAALSGCVGEAYWCEELDWIDFRFRALYDRLEAELAQ